MVKGNSNNRIFIFIFIFVCLFLGIEKMPYGIRRTTELQVPWNSQYLCKFCTISEMDVLTSSPTTLIVLVGSEGLRIKRMLHIAMMLVDCESFEVIGFCLLWYHGASGQVNWNISHNVFILLYSFNPWVYLLFYYNHWTTMRILMRYCGYMYKVNSILKHSTIVLISLIF